MDRYDIFWKNRIVGEACVETVGLYTSFQCRCDFQITGLYRIIAQYGFNKADLGVCIPEENGYVAYAKIPTKRLSDDIPKFYVTEGASGDKFFIPVHSREEFNYISRLPEARFYIQAGEKGVLIDKN